MIDKIEDYVIEESKHSKFNDLDDIIEPKIGIFHSVCSFFSGIFSPRHKVGELNGHWAILFKMVIIIVVLSVPTMFAWCTWVTNEVFAGKYHRAQTESFENRIDQVERNIKILDKLELELLKISNKIENLPPPDWRRRIELLEEQRKTDEIRTIEQSKQNGDEHNQILILLEGIKTKVNLISKE